VFSFKIKENIMAKDHNQESSEFKIIKLIKNIPDPRIKRCQKHPLESIFFIVFVAGLCGANNWVEVVSMGEALEDWIKKFVLLPFGIPSHDTFGRIFSLICPKAFNKLLEEWVSFIRKHIEGEVVSFDGKTLRGTKNNGNPLHLLNAWSIDNGMCLGQLPVDQKTNEMKVLPKLIKLLELKDCIITADALNTQKSVAKAVIEAGADYVLPVKKNHPNLLEDIALFFDDAFKREFKGIDVGTYETLEKSHGRIESRKYYVLDGEELPNRKNWKGLKSIGMVVREREIKGKIEKECVYYIMSIEMDAKLFERCVRGHWAVENSLHWRLDVIFREDESRYRDKIGAQNLSIIRKMTLGALSRDKISKGGIQAKRLRAAGNAQYREFVLKNLL